MSANSPKNGTELVQVPRAQSGNVTARRDGGGDELTYNPETASSAVATAARADIEARFIVAQRRPRDIMEVRADVLKACARPRFAEVAIYHKPVGKGIEGPSIRMAEELVRCMKNIASDCIVLYDDPWKRIVKVVVTDLENNVTHPASVTIDKLVERRELRKGQSARSQRVNSYGDVVYLVDATDDEIANKVNAAVSKAMRTCILRLIPGDIVEEAVDACYATRRNRDAKDPAAAVKTMCDYASGRLGIHVEDMAVYLGHPVDKTTLDELDHLRNLFAAIKDGETTWAAALEHRRGQPSVADSPPAPGGPEKAGSLSEAAARAKAEREKKAAPPAGAPPAEKKRNTILGPDNKPMAVEPPPEIDDGLAGAEPEPGSDG